MPLKHVSRCLSFTGAVALSFALAACGATEASEPTSQNDATDTVNSGDEATAKPSYRDNATFTHKMMLATADNPPTSSLGYECSECTFEQWKSIVPPEGWSKGPAQILLADSGELRSEPTHPDHPSSVDFLEDMPGEEFKLIVINTGAEFIEITEARMVVKATVIRDTILEFNPGRLLHILTSPEGKDYVLFAMGIDPDNVVIPDTDAPDVLGDFVAPEGWTYSTEVATDGLTLEASGLTNVIAFRSTSELTWEERD